MTVKYVDGDMLKGKEDIIVQQVNAKGVMGAGLAKSIYQKYPVVRTDYISAHKRLVAEGKTPQDMLGMVMFVQTKSNEQHYVANIIGQADIRKGANDKKVYTDYAALKLGLERVRQIAEQADLTVALPYEIGCGLANGSWLIVSGIIHEVFDNSKADATIYKFIK